MRTEKFGLKVDDKLIEFVEAKALPGIDISSDDFWKGLSDLVNRKRCQRDTLGFEVAGLILLYVIGLVLNC